MPLRLLRLPHAPGHASKLRVVEVERGLVKVRRIRVCVIARPALDHARVACRSAHTNTIHRASLPQSRLAMSAHQKLPNTSTYFRASAWIKSPRMHTSLSTCAGAARHARKGHETSASTWLARPHPRCQLHVLTVWNTHTRLHTRRNTLRPQGARGQMLSAHRVQDALKLRVR